MWLWALAFAGDANPCRAGFTCVAVGLTIASANGGKDFRAGVREDLADPGLIGRATTSISEIAEFVVFAL